MRESKPWQTFVLIVWRLGLTVCVLGVLAAFIIAFPNPILKPLLLYSINTRIPGEIEIEYLSWSRDSLKAKDITYTAKEGSTPITAKEISAGYIFQEDYVPKIVQIQTIGLRIPTTYDPEKGLVIEGIPTFEEDTQGFGFEFPLPTLHMMDTSLFFETEYGEVTLSMNGNAALNNGNITLHGQGSLNSPFLSLKGDLNVQGKPPLINGSFILHKLVAPQLFTLPIQGKGQFKMDKKQIIFTGAFANTSLGIVFKTKTTHDIEKNTSYTQIDFRLPNFKAALDASTTKIPDLPQISGGVSGKADITYQNNAMKGKTSLILDNINVRDAEYNAQGIKGTIHFSNLETFTTPPGQKITIQKLDSFLPLRNVTLVFQHKGNGKISIEKTSADFEKGTLTTGPFTFESLEKGVAFSLHMKNVSAHYLASFSKLSNLNVTGMVDGEMELQVKDRDFGIRKGGMLRVNNPPGIIQYRPDISKQLKHNLANLTGDENPMDLALIALWNLHYTSLNMTLDKPLGAELNATLHVKGKNPDAFSGHPFEFNINVSGETLKMITEALASIE